MNSSRQRTSPRPPNESDAPSEQEDDAIVDVHPDARTEGPSTRKQETGEPRVDANDGDSMSSVKAGPERASAESDRVRRTTPQEAFDSGRTTLNLENISDEELDAFFFEDEVEPESWFNAPTLTGIALIVVGLVYLLAEMGIFSAAALPQIASVLPWLAGIFVVVLGFGLLSRGRSDSRREKEETERRKARSSAQKHTPGPAREPSFSRTTEGHSANQTSTRSQQRSATTSESSGYEGPSKYEDSRERRREQTSADRTSGSSWNPFKGEKSLRRSMSNKRIMGVCSGIARYFGLDVTLVRVAFVIGLLVTGGQFAFAYIALGWAMPKDTELSDEERMRIIRDS